MLATHCPVCVGHLVPRGRYGTVQSFICDRCGAWFEQRLPRWFADLLAA